MGKSPAPQTTVVQAAPVPTAAPPVSKTAADVVQATTDLRQQEMLKKNIRQTVRAGDTGGFKPLPNPMKGPGGRPGGL